MVLVRHIVREVVVRSGRSRVQGPLHLIETHGIVLAQSCGFSQSVYVKHKCCEGGEPWLRISKKQHQNIKVRLTFQ